MGKPSAGRRSERPHVSPPRRATVQILDGWIAVIRTPVPLDDADWQAVLQRAAELADNAPTELVPLDDEAIWLKPDDPRVIGVPPPIRPDPNIIGNIEGNRRIREQDRAVAQQQLDSIGCPHLVVEPPDADGSMVCSACGTVLT